MAKQINVAIIDDHALVRTGIKYMLKEAMDIKVVGEGQSGEEAMVLVKETKPDVVLMDINMPGIGGLGATRKLLRINPNMRIIIVTVCNNALFPAKLIQAGAYGYLTKGCTKKQLLKAIYTVQSGQRYLAPEIASLLAIRHLDETTDTPFEQLSERELQVAIMITKGIKVPEISNKLCLSSKTVNSYRYRIQEKLNIKSDVELTHLALRHEIIESFSREEAKND